MRCDSVAHDDKANDARTAEIGHLLASAYLRLKRQRAANYQQNGQLRTNTDSAYMTGPSAAPEAYIVVSQQVGATTEEAP